jgi:hypothetical protein
MPDEATKTRCCRSTGGQFDGVSIAQPGRHSLAGRRAATPHQMNDGFNTTRGLSLRSLREFLNHAPECKRDIRSVEF